MEYKNDVVSKRVSNLNVLPIHVSVCGVHAPCVCECFLALMAKLNETRTCY